MQVIRNYKKQEKKMKLAKKKDKDKDKEEKHKTKIDKNLLRPRTTSFIIFKVKKNKKKKFFFKRNFFFFKTTSLSSPRDTEKYESKIVLLYKAHERQVNASVKV